mgnify:CR=1 FL=1
MQKAIDDGYDRIVLVLTRPKDVLREQKRDIAPSRILRHSYPAAAERLLNRYATYNDEVALAKKYERDGRVLILAPDDLCGLSTLSKSSRDWNSCTAKATPPPARSPTTWQTEAWRHTPNYRAVGKATPPPPDESPIPTCSDGTFADNASDWNISH